MTVTMVSRKCLFLLYLLVPLAYGDLTLGVTQPTESPAPSPSPSAAPSESPTDSPAPSPSPSASPTETPTGTPQPTAKPTENPTESPAPSPSPSASPTENPTLEPTVSPTVSPTVTPMPTDSPSDSPSNVPSDGPSDFPSDAPSFSAEPSASPSAAPTISPSSSPSDMPSYSPTVSHSPSYVPSDTPSEVPSLAPSFSPTKNPTTSPSVHPTDKPSSSPTRAPTERPSEAPTMTPTEEGFNTKTGVTNVALVDIEREMGDTPLSRFEITTLEFIRDTQPATPGYDVEILAVTALTQEVIYSDEAEIGKDNEGGRRLQISKAALKVAFRTVGVVTHGKVPQNFTLADVSEYGFQHHWNEYLFRLFNADPFFEPLQSSIEFEEKIDDSSEPGEQQNKGQYYAAILFSTFAFVVAIFASVYAIKKHLNTRRPRTTDKSHMLEYPGFTKTYSESDDSGPANQLELDIEKCEKDDMEDVGLSPCAVDPSFNGCTTIPEEGMSLSPSTVGNESKRSSFGRLSETSANIKKWLTPRLSMYSTKSSTFIDIPGSDPPDSEAGYNVRLSADPSALKASTSKQNGVLSSDSVSAAMDTKKNNVTGTTPLSIPMNFFGKEADGISEASGTPMGSLADSTVSSFFMKMGKSVFTGRESMQSDAGGSVKAAKPKKFGWGSEAGTSEATNQYTFGSTTGGTSRKPKTSYPPKPMKTKDLNATNLAPMADRKQTPGPKKANQQYKPYNYDGQDAPIEHRAKRSRTFDEESVSSEQSELQLNELGQDKLGAGAPRWDQQSQSTFVGHDYGQRMGVKAPSTIGGSRANESTTLGARPLGEAAKTQYKEKSSLSAVMKLEGTYDVFAPSGPIGIVVDTSKDGPAVHSLKSTSPLLGLISPGDLIIALDDEDTRDMTAASLTRLMAKKSRQKERKITLLAPDGF